MEEIKPDQNQTTISSKEEEKKNSLPEEQKISQTQSNEANIKVDCLEPRQQNGHTVYTIKGEDNKGPFEVVRRFNDFFNFRQVLLNKWPGNYIPPIPPKKAVGNTDPAFIEERRQELDYFLKQLSKLSHLWYSEENQIFIRQDVDKMALLSKVDYSQLIKKYEEQFSKLEGQEVGAEVVTKISQFASYLKSANLFLENYKNQVIQHVGAQKSHHEQLLQFINVVLPNYESICMKTYLNDDYDNKLLALPNKNEEFGEIKKYIDDLSQFNSRNEYVSLINMLKFEMRDIEAFQEALEIKAQYEANKKKFESKLLELQQDLEKAMQGKASITTTITGKQNSQVISELEKESATCNETIKQLTIICDKIALILANCEIDRFKQQKLDAYYQIQKKLSAYELEYEKAKLNLWEQIANNKNLQQ